MPLSLTDHLHPDLLDKVNKVLAAMAAAGFLMRICQGIRTAEEQHELWRQGREIPGPNVTAARPLGATVTNCDGYAIKSNHQMKVDGYGHAVDCCFVGTEPFAEEHPWDAYGALGEALGLTWGGRWKRPHDRPHLELR